MSKVWEVDFTPPFRRVYMVQELERELSVSFPPPTEFGTPGTLIIHESDVIYLTSYAFSSPADYSFPEVSG